MGLWKWRAQVDSSRIENPPDDNSREKEVYARYGFTMFDAQAFESALVMLILMGEVAEAEHTGTRGNSRSPETLLDDLYGRTAGRLLGRLKE